MINAAVFFYQVDLELVRAPVSKEACPGPGKVESKPCLVSYAQTLKGWLK